MSISTMFPHTDEIIFVFNQMNEQEVSQFHKDRSECDSLGDMINKGYGFGGVHFSNEIQVYKKEKPQIIIIK